MPHLSKPQAAVLALWSFGMVISQSCGLTTVSSSLAALLAVKENSMRQRLREWYYAKEQKRGKQRCEIDVRHSFVPLLHWILSWWSPNEKRLALAIDATSLGQTLVVLAISVVYRSCAIPIAWRVLPAIEQGSWKEPWLELFSHFQEQIPEDWVVIVLADRGLYAKWLWEAIQKCKWHPFLRINSRFFFRPEEAREFAALQFSFQQPGQRWAGRGTCFKVHSIQATLLVQWEDGFEVPWLILTDLSPECVLPCWYGLRVWIECGFKHMKSAGWQWQYTRMVDAQRATRFWLTLAVATLWVLSVGGEVESALATQPLERMPDHQKTHHRPLANSSLRLLSCFHRGLLFILSSLIAHKSLPLGRFIPQPWPT